MEKEEILIPDEYIRNHNASDEENAKREKEYRERLKEAFEKLGLIDGSK